MFRWSLLLILLLPLAIAQAQDDMPIYGLVVVDAAEVRVGPDFAYDAIGQLPLNASVEILGRAGDWFGRWDGRQWIQVIYGDRNGWVYARLLRTSESFNSLPVRGMMLPRNRNGRVPDGFDLSSYVCDQWQGEFARDGDFSGGAASFTVRYPALQGATLYSVIVISPTGFRTAFDSETTTATLEFNLLPAEGGTYTWRVAPYWTYSTTRWQWQQVCPLQTGGTFEKPAR
jgi:uncharacterized protein YraI